MCLTPSPGFFFLLLTLKRKKERGKTERSSRKGNCHVQLNEN
jgi:hypothetical protein